MQVIRKYMQKGKPEVAAVPETCIRQRSPSSLVEDATTAVEGEQRALVDAVEQSCRGTFHRYIVKLANEIDGMILERIRWATAKGEYIEHNVPGIGQDARFMALSLADRIISNIKGWTVLAEFAREEADVVLLMQTALFVSSKMFDPEGACSAKYVNAKRWQDVIKCERLLLEALNYDVVLRPPSANAYDRIRSFYEEGPAEREEHIKKRFKFAESALDMCVRYPLDQRVFKDGWELRIGDDMARKIISDFGILSPHVPDQVPIEWVREFLFTQTNPMIKITQQIYDHINPKPQKKHRATRKRQRPLSVSS